MSQCIGIDLGCVDIYFNDFVAGAIAEGTEEDLLGEMADQMKRAANESKHEGEQKFFAAAALKCAELAKWFSENQP